MYKFTNIQRVFLIVVFILLSGCGGSPNVQVNELSTNTVSYDETIHINNCGGKADSEQTASRSFATTIEGGAEFSAGYQSIVEGGVSAKYSQYRNISKSQRLIAPPATDMEFVLRWSEDIHAGNVTVNGTTGNYEVRVPVAVEQISSRDLGCDTTQSQEPVSNPTAIPSPTESGSNNQNSSSFIASSPLVINGKSYSVPTSNTPFCIASEQTGYTSSGVDYDLVVPKGWVIVWDSWKAYWSDGKYENDGLLIVSGNFQGKVTIVNGEYCAVLVEWKDFAINLRANAVARASRPQFTIGEQP